jgi:hypothetical protein
MHLRELNSLGSNTLLNFFSVSHQVSSTLYSQFLHFTWFIRLIAPKQHCFVQTIHILLMFIYNHVTPSCCLLGYLVTHHFITG